MLLQLGDLLYVAGQIAMCPADLSIIEGGVQPQCRLSLRHVQRILAAMHSGTGLKNVLLSICYVTKRMYIEMARKELARSLEAEKVVTNYNYCEMCKILNNGIHTG